MLHGLCVRPTDQLFYGHPAANAAGGMYASDECGWWLLSHSATPAPGPAPQPRQ